MEFSDAEIIVKSKFNPNIYYLFNDKIVVCRNNLNCSTINLPQINNIICFYDMYYTSDGLRIVIATQNNYDLVAILDEDDLTMSIKHYTK